MEKGFLFFFSISSSTLVTWDYKNSSSRLTSVAEQTYTIHEERNEKDSVFFSGFVEVSQTHRGEF